MDLSSPSTFTGIPGGRLVTRVTPNRGQRVKGDLADPLEALTPALHDSDLGLERKDPPLDRSTSPRLGSPVLVTGALVLNPPGGMRVASWRHDRTAAGASRRRGAGTDGKSVEWRRFASFPPSEAGVSTDGRVLPLTRCSDPPTLRVGAEGFPSPRPIERQAAAASRPSTRSHHSDPPVPRGPGTPPAGHEHQRKEMAHGHSSREDWNQA
jgi:hypothetical protein